ncbi:MAG: prolyl oligopeptidase family serine peptidase [Methanomicrobiales archaeon]|nr:prolyl oligopeptidase family serine peptidase [Methanomicrobiales archaeon]
MTFRSSLFLILPFLIFALLMCPVTAKDTHNPLLQHEIEMTEFFYPDNAVSHIYHADIQPDWVRPDAFWYEDTARDGSSFYSVNVTQGTKKRLFDSKKFTRSFEKATGKEVKTARLPLHDMDLSSDENFFSFSAYNDQWSCDLSNYFITKQSLPPEIQAGILSPDRSAIAYINGSDLWIYNTSTRTKTPLTNDGTDNYFYSKRSDAVRYAASETRLREYPTPYLVWSPNSENIATYRVDQRNVSPLWLVQNAPETGKRPVLYSYRFAYPGDTHVPLYEPMVIQVDARQIVPIKYRAQPEVSMMDTEENVLQWWDSTGNTTYSLFIERGEKILRLLSANPKTGEVRELIREDGTTYIESTLTYADNPNIKILSNGDIIWFSERDGWGHLYRYDAKGTLKNQITKGEWVVRKILAVDEKNGHIYFIASGKEKGNPYYQYLYRVQTDGNDLKLLTKGQADHQVSLAPDFSCFVDAYSRTDLPTVTVLRSMEGNLLMHLATADDSDLQRKNWISPERFSVKARDKTTDLYGLLFKPTNFDKTKKYPVIDVVYPGPYTIVTATRYPADLSWNSKIFWTCQMLSELGFIVVTMDGMGTAYRSKEFHNYSYGHLSDCGLPDHIAGIKELTAKRPFMDINRVGIYGKSAGGFMAAQAMLTYPEFFKVGVAASGDLDCRLYGSFWGEKYEGYPDLGTYDEQVTALKAENLAGKLLLLTGDMDDNVHPSMTIQLADSLQKAGKEFDMFIFTNKNHDLNYDPYYMKKMIGYLNTHL